MIEKSKVIPANINHDDISFGGYDYHLAMAFLPDDNANDCRFAFAKIEVTFSDSSKSISGVPDLSRKQKLELVEEALNLIKNKIKNG